MQSYVFQLLLIALIVSVVQSFMMTPSRLIIKKNVATNFLQKSASLTGTKQVKVFMAGDDEDVDDAVPEFDNDQDKNLFEMNRITRLGRSKDQDGKSNIWSIEPAMEVIEGEEESDTLKKNLLIGGAIIGVAIACLPLFNVLSSFMPESDF